MKTEYVERYMAIRLDDDEQKQIPGHDRNILLYSPGKHSGSNSELYCCSGYVQNGQHYMTWNIRATQVIAWLWPRLLAQRDSDPNIKRFLNECRSGGTSDKPKTLPPPKPRPNTGVLGGKANGRSGRKVRV